MDPQTTTTSTSKIASQNRENENEKPVGRKQSIIVGVISLILILLAGGAMFWILFTQSNIDEAPKKIFQQHKTEIIDFAEKAVQVVRNFPHFLNDFAIEHISSKLFDYIRQELNIPKMKQNTVPVFTEFDWRTNQPTLEIIHNCTPPKGIILEKNAFMKLLNEPFEIKRKEMVNIEKPVNDSQLEFDKIIEKESRKPGRLSKQNMIGYSKSIVTVLEDYQSRTVTRDDSFIKSYETQVDSRHVAELAHLILTIVFYSIDLLIFAAIMTIFIFYQRRKLLLEKLKKLSRILMIISAIFVIGWLIFAVLGYFDISPFFYDCELKSESQNPIGKFTNFDGKQIDIGKLNGGCEKGDTVYSIMNPFLNSQIIDGYLRRFQSDVQSFVTGLIALKIGVTADEIGIHSLKLQNQIALFTPYKAPPCNTEINGQQYVKNLINLMSSHISDLGQFNSLKLGIPEKLITLPSETATFMQTSFNELQNISVKTCSSIKSQLDSSDYSCYLEMPPGLCENRDTYFSNINIVWWIMLGIYVLNFLLSWLLYLIPNSIIKRRKHSAKMEKMRKEEEEKKKKEKEDDNNKRIENEEKQKKALVNKLDVVEKQNKVMGKELKATKILAEEQGNLLEKKQNQIDEQGVELEENRVEMKKADKKIFDYQQEIGKQTAKEFNVNLDEKPWSKESIKSKSKSKMEKSTKSKSTITKSSKK